ncbi:MAG: transporter substrate-binding domain-containing protein [Roseateles sp.]|jgi:polar amino acid transport system substrate-binding protein|nr:transporter substrate-binding domain-containing protein [Burkholderiaceae bacterium]|mmetsp:Transcript_50956/g.119463  ORF Transcript_50956/g.119463 Transcript_50956/m.119463 type:complete len:240 (-) Transcript_50956:550-1269(-)
MPRVRLFLLLALLLPIAGPALPLPAGPTIIVFPSPGVFDVSATGEVSGIGASVVQRLAEVSGLALSMQPMPPARALLTVQQQHGYCVVALPRTPEREALFRWVGQISSASVALYARADDSRRIETPADLRGAVIVVQRESRPLAWLKEQGLTAYEVSDTATGLRMLRAGRVDFWAVNEIAGLHAVASAPAPQPRLVASFSRIELYLACHRELSNELSERLAAALEQLRREGDLRPLGLR